MRVSSAPTASLTAALAHYVKMRSGEIISAEIWDDADIPAHLKMNYRVIDDAGRELATGRDLAALKAQLGQAAQLTFAKAEPGIERAGLTSWDCGDVPEQISFERAGRKLTGYPALVDEGESVAIRLFDTRDAADASMRAGVCRLLRIELKEQMKQLDKTLPGLTQAVMQLRGVANADDLKADLVTAICDRAFIGDDELPRNEKEYAAQKQRARTRLPAVRDAACRMFAAIAEEHHRASLRLGSAPSSLNRVAADLRAQLQRLVYKGFVSRDAVGAAPASAALSQGDDGAARQIPRQPGARRETRRQHRGTRGSSIRSAATNCARRAGTNRRSRISAGRSRNCACRCSRRN